MPDTNDIALARAAEKHAAGDTDAALQLLGALLRSDPRKIGALHLRYRIERERGSIAQARDTLARIIAADPRQDWARNALIRLLFEHGQWAEAERVARAALRMNPDDAVTHDLFGTVLSERNELTAGEWHFRRALELGGETPHTLANLGLNLMQQGQVQGAEEAYRRAETLAPGDPRVLSQWSKLAEVAGDVPRARRLLDRAAAAASEQDVNLLRARLCARGGEHAKALAILDQAGEMNGDAHLERGRLRDRFGRYTEAWEDFVEGKRKLAAQAGGAAYQDQAVAVFFERLRHFFVAANASRLPRAPVREDAAQPIFVCGSPRSGTTLLEQILSSHSQVRAGGELAFAADLRNLTNRLFPDDGAFPENLARTWTADGHWVAALFRDYYLARAAETRLTEPACRFFVDKMPFNEMYFPLIRMAFPVAPIIRIVRHPMDVCVSMMAHNLTHGFNCAYRLTGIAVHLVAVHELIEHYRRELEPDELVVRYEDLVGDQEIVTRGLLDHAGLPFEGACLRFHANDRYARTPSYDQVSEPLHDRSIGRYKHYAAPLREVVPILEPMLSSLGYTL